MNDKNINFKQHWLHKSHLKVYKLCKMKFFETYNDVIFKDKFNGSYALSLGTAFHEVAAYIVDNKINDIEQLENSIQNAELYDYAEWFIETNNDIKLYEPKKNEQIVVDNTETYLETTTYLRGTLDRFYYNEDKELVLVEYKTGKSTTFSNTDIDFGFYHIMLEANNQFPDKWQFINPKKQKVQTKPFVQKYIDKTIDMISEIRHNTKNKFVPNNYLLFCCDDCCAKYKCPTYTKRLPNGLKALTDTIEKNK